MLDTTINLWAVLISAIVSMVIGGFWYSPSGFGKQWMAISGISKKMMEECKKKGMIGAYITTFIGCLVMAFILANFIKFTNAMTMGEGMLTGFWIWLGFIATNMIGMVVWEGKPMKLFWIKSLQVLVVLLVNGAILAVWA